MIIYLGNIINDHKACKAMGKIDEGDADDLVHVLLNFHDHGDLGFSFTTDNIKTVIMVSKFTPSYVLLNSQLCTSLTKVCQFSYFD